MPTAHDVPHDLLIGKLSEHLRKLSQINPPMWTRYVKTGSFAERLPQDKDWWYTRCASVIRKVYIHGPIGLTDLKSMYGGGKRIGYGGIHHRNGGGSAVRIALKQLEAAGLVTKKQGKGRFVTSRGRSLLDRLSTEIFNEIAKSNPSLSRYS